MLLIISFPQPATPSASAASVSLRVSVRVSRLCRSFVLVLVLTGGSPASVVRSGRCRGHRGMPSPRHQRAAREQLAPLAPRARMPRRPQFAPAAHRRSAASRSSRSASICGVGGRRGRRCVRQAKARRSLHRAWTFFMRPRKPACDGDCGGGNVKQTSISWEVKYVRCLDISLRDRSRACHRQGCRSRRHECMVARFSQRSSHPLDGGAAPATTCGARSSGGWGYAPQAGNDCHRFLDPISLAAENTAPVSD